MKTLRFPACVAIAVALAACATVVRQYGETPNASVSPATETVVVQQDDMPYGIALRDEVKVEDLAVWNALSAPYTTGATLAGGVRGGNCKGHDETDQPQVRGTSALLVKSATSSWPQRLLTFECATTAS